MPKTQEEVFQIIYNGLIFVGIILSIVALSINSHSNANVSISSYTFISAGVILIIGFLINKILNLPNLSKLGFFSVFLTNVGPFLLLIGILAFTLYLIITFKDKINSGNISSAYGLFSKLTIAFILIQLYITYYGMQSPEFKESGSLSKIYSSFSYLVGVINVSIVLILASILKYFSTDG
jgi:hypothetical protein